MTDTPTTQYAKSADGTNLAFQVSGVGPIHLVFLPGLGIPIDLMSDEPHLVRFRKRLSSFSCTVWFETGGFGSSEGDAVDSQVEEVFAADLTAVLDAVGCGRVTLMGTSPNGPNAIGYAATHPERLNSLVLVNTFAHYVREDDCPWGLPAEALGRFVTGTTAI